MYYMYMERRQQLFGVMFYAVGEKVRSPSCYLYIYEGLYRCV